MVYIWNPLLKWRNRNKTANNNNNFITILLFRTDWLVITWHLKVSLKTLSCFTSSGLCCVYSSSWKWTDHRLYHYWVCVQSWKAELYLHGKKCECGTVLWFQISQLSLWASMNFLWTPDRDGLPADEPSSYTVLGGPCIQSPSGGEVDRGLERQPLLQTKREAEAVH